jgi:hypothetical protein
MSNPISSPSGVHSIGDVGSLAFAAGGEPTQLDYRELAERLLAARQDPGARERSREFASLVRTHMVEHGLTSEDLAEAVGATPTQVQALAFGLLADTELDAPFVQRLTRIVAPEAGQETASSWVNQARRCVLSLQTRWSTATGRLLVSDLAVLAGAVRGGGGDEGRVSVRLEPGDGPGETTVEVVGLPSSTIESSLVVLHDRDDVEWAQATLAGGTATLHLDDSTPEDLTLELWT